ncbi:MAG: hypothetical protein BGO49_15105 [Planctomycetales bacterium 71-10]|nr:MAG: hypothetical protein BGO49_15105 [Planctomycetales bacterium 71-10]
MLVKTFLLFALFFSKQVFVDRPAFPAVGFHDLFNDFGRTLAYFFGYCFLLLYPCFVRLFSCLLFVCLCAFFLWRLSLLALFRLWLLLLFTSFFLLIFSRLLLRLHTQTFQHAFRGIHFV